MAWKTVRADEFCSFVTDGTHDSPKPQSQGRKLITSKHLKGDYIDFDSANWISEGDYQKIIARSAVEQWDILFSMIGTIGTIYLEKNPIVEYACKNMGVFKFAGNAENAFWMYYYLKSPQAKEYIQSHLRGSTQAYVPLGSLREMPVSIPDRETRNRIVSLLKPLDEKIATNRAINDNLQQQAASIFAEWLNTCTDFSTIGDMAHNILDYSSVASEQIRLLNSSDVTEGVFPVIPLVPNKDLKGHFKKRFQFGDILYSEIRPRNHHYGLVLFDASDYIASTRLMVIRAIEKKVSPVMLYQYLLLPEVEAEFTLKTESRSGTFPQGNYADMASIQVPYSPTNSQTAVSEILSRIRFAIAQNQFESQRLAELRDTLLPKLMSGDIDVSAVQL